MKIRITEGQSKRLFEAMMPGFRLDVLRNMSYNAKVKYCTQMLGRPIGNGSSRVVFQIDDETVLILAKNEKGIAQNEAEINYSNDCYSGRLFPHIKNGTDTKNYLWIVSEYVLPAKMQDFTEIYGVTFKDITSFVFYVTKRMDATVFSRNYGDAITKIYDKYYHNEDAQYLLSQLEDLRGSYDMNVIDLGYIRNWGLVKRNGEADLVILDAGFSQDVFNKYYRIR